MNLKNLSMDTLTIEKKEYVVVPKKEYENLLAKAASKAIPAKSLALLMAKNLLTN